MHVSQEQMHTLRVYLNSIYDVCEEVDLEGTEVEYLGRRINVRKLFEIEITAYLLYLSASDNVLAEEEIQFINELMGREYSLESCESFILENKVITSEFSKSTPLSFRLLSDYTSKQGKDITETLISFYDTLGIVVSSSDLQLAASEEEARKGYVYLLRGYHALTQGE